MARSTRVGLIASLAAVGVLAWACPAFADPCRGTKVFHNGKCVYPEDVPKAKPPPPKVVPKPPPPKVVPKPPPPKGVPKPPPPKAAPNDGELCKAARKADALDTWAAYLKAFPEGVCVAEAGKRIAELTKAAAPPPVAPPDPPKPPPPEPEPVAKPEPPAPEKKFVPIAPRPAPRGPRRVYVGAPDSAYYGLGAGIAIMVVGGAVGLGTGLAALDQASVVDEQCPGDVCPESAREDYDSALAVSRASSVFLAIGGVGALTTLISGIVIGTSDDYKTVGSLEPVIGPGGAGLRGSF